MATPVAAERAWCVVVPHHPAGAGEARSRMSAELRSAVHPDLLSDAISVIAELVGNAIRHAEPLPGDVIRVAWQVRHAGETETIAIRVTDGGSAGRPAIRVAEADAVDGRGLTIVAALATAWGIDRDGLGQSVWAELSAPIPALPC